MLPLGDYLDSELDFFSVIPGGNLTLIAASCLVYYGRIRYRVCNMNCVLLGGWRAFLGVLTYEACES